MAPEGIHPMAEDASRPRQAGPVGLVEKMDVRVCHDAETGITKKGTVILAKARICITGETRIPTCPRVDNDGRDRRT